MRLSCEAKGDDGNDDDDDDVDDDGNDSESFTFEDFPAVHPFRNGRTNKRRERENFSGNFIGIGRRERRRMFRNTTRIKPFPGTT